MSVPQAPQGPTPALAIPEGQDYPRLVYAAPYFTTVPLAELIEPAVTEAVEAALPGLVPPYVDQAANAAVQQLAVLLAGSTMQGPLYLNPVMPTQPSQAASMAYVDAMIATAGVPEVPATPIGQTWARQVGQWVPIDPEGGTFLPLSGGTMQGQINMSGNAITNLPALPVFPNGAAPAQWVLNQISSVSLYQGTWNMDTYTPDLTQSQYHINGYTWIALTTEPGGVVIAPAIPGLQGTTIFNGDTVIFSSTNGAFQSIHSGGLTLPEAQALFLQLTGGQMQGNLFLNANATSGLQAVTFQQFNAAISGFVTPDAPGDGQGYLRVGLGQTWVPGVPLAGGAMTGPLLLSANATNALGAVTLQQLNATLTGGYVAITGASMTGLLVLSGNATAPFNPVPLSQLNSMLGGYLSTTGGSINGTLTIGSSGATPNTLSVGGQGISYLTQGAAGANIGFGYASSQLTVYQNGAAVPLGYLPLVGGAVTGATSFYSATATPVVAISHNLSLPFPAPLAGTSLQVGGLIELEGWGGSGTFVCRSANGTQTSPTPPTNGFYLGGIRANAWNGSAYTSYGPCAINFQAGETWTTAANGAAMIFYVTPTGTVSAQPVAQIGPNTTYFTQPVYINSGQLFTQAAGSGNANLLFTNSAGNQVGILYYSITNNLFLLVNSIGGGNLSINSTGNTSTSGAFTANGTIQSLSGYQARSGTPGPFQGNVFNIDWVSGLAHLWIDNVNNGAIAYQCDYRIKKDVTDLPSMWEVAKALHPIKYTQAEYNPPGTTPQPRDPADPKGPTIPMFPADDVERWGFIAHELQTTLTQSAATGVKDQPDAIQSPNPLTLLACLTKALQEAMARIEALEAAAAA